MYSRWTRSVTDSCWSQRSFSSRVCALIKSKASSHFCLYCVFTFLLWAPDSRLLALRAYRLEVKDGSAITFSLLCRCEQMPGGLRGETKQGPTAAGRGRGRRAARLWSRKADEWRRRKRIQKTRAKRRRSTDPKSGCWFPDRGEEGMLYECKAMSLV